MADASPDAIQTALCHLEGITRICFSPDGSSIYTSGSDTLIRIHNADAPDSEPGFFDNRGDAVTSLSAARDHVVAGSMDAVARRFSAPPKSDFEGYVTRAQGVPIRWVSLDLAGERVAVCSDDLIVKIVHVTDDAQNSLLSDNAKPVRSAAWDPTGKFLVTAGCDGKLKVYDTSGTSPINVKVAEGIRTSEVDAEASCYVAWHPSGNYFALPTRTNDVGVIAKDGWSKQAPFSADGHSGPVSELAWSANGRYLASAAGKQILVWATESRQVVARHTHSDGNVSGLAWSPKSNLLAYTAMDGSFNRWTEPVPSALPSPVLTEAAAAKKVERLLDDGLFGDGDEDMDEQGEDLADEVDDWIIDDEGVYAAAEDTEETWAKGRTEVVNVTKAQDAFVPGATAWKSKKRYLAFNMIGVVDATDQETHNVVNVEFHDRSARRGYHFSDDNKFTMASLGEQGIVYAAPTSDENPSSVIHYRPYDSWASASDWKISLPAGENAVSVAAGGPENGIGTVVVATSRGMVRFFTSSGVQRYVWRLGEDVVTLAAGRDALLVVHREGGTSLDGCQNLRYSLLDLETFDTVQEGRVPLPRKTTITWAGFSFEGLPCMYDSDGVLSVLDRFRRPGQARWVPLFDAAERGKKETYWPVGIGAEHVHALILRGSEKEPSFPRPLIHELELHIPVLGDDSQSALEEKIARRSVMLSVQDDAASKVQIDKELLQLVQGACKADQLARALDVARLMHATSTLDAAAKIAHFYQLPGLEERIGEVKSMKGYSHSWVDSAPAESYQTRPRAPKARENGQFSDFAPTVKKRTFGCREGRENRVAVERAETPAASAQTFIPETPGAEDTTLQILDTNVEEPESMSPKRKRDDDSFDFPPPKLDAGKNPFAKRAAPSNPFAKQATARPLDSIKSTSFFERVDDIEASGKASKRKPAAKAAASRDNSKQMTLMGMGKRPQPKEQDSFLSTSTETETMLGDESEDLPPTGFLDDSLVQETVETLGDGEETQLD